MKKLLLTIILVTSLFSSESDNIIESSAYGKKIVNENKAPTYKKEDKQYYGDEVLFNYILVNRGQNEEPYNVKKYVARESKLIDLVKQKDLNNTTKQVTNPNSTIVKGYCNFGEDIYIGKQPSSAFVQCSTNIGLVKIFGNLIPKNKIATLFFDPQYIEYKNTRFKVLPESITTNEARTSYNIATFVNDRKLAKIGYQSAIASTNIIHGATHEYLLALEKSKTSKSVNYVGNGNNSNSDVIAIQKEQTQKPEVKDYAISAGVDIVAGVVKTAAEAFKKDLPYLYEIKKGSNIYVDLKINKTGEKIK